MERLRSREGKDDPSFSFSPSFTRDFSDDLHLTARTRLDADGIGNVLAQLLWKPQGCNPDVLYWLRADYQSKFLMLGFDHKFSEALSYASELCIGLEPDYNYSPEGAQPMVMSLRSGPSYKFSDSTSMGIKAYAGKSLQLANEVSHKFNDKISVSLS